MASQIVIMHQVELAANQTTNMTQIDALDVTQQPAANQTTSMNKMEPEANQTKTVNWAQALNAIQQLMANQTMIINQMTAMSCNVALKSIAHKCKNLVSAHFPYPTQCFNVVTADDNDDVTIVT